MNYEDWENALFVAMKRTSGEDIFYKMPFELRLAMIVLLKDFIIEYHEEQWGDQAQVECSWFYAEAPTFDVDIVLRGRKNDQN